MPQNFMYSSGQSPASGLGSLRDDGGNILLQDIDDDRLRVQKYMEWFLYATEQTSQLRDRIIEDLRFLNNDQYSDVEKAYFRKPATEGGGEGRPTITINFSTGIVNTVLGVEARSRTETKLLPFEPGDVENADVFGVLLKGIEKKISRKQKNSKAFKYKAAVGLGWQKLSYDFKKRKQGEIRLDFVNPLEVVWDPNYPDCEWKDAKWAMHAQYRTLDSLIAQFPKWEDEIRQKWGEWLRPSGGDAEHLGDSNTAKRSFWDADTQRAQLLEVWCKEWREQEVAILADGQIITDEDKVEAYKAASKGVEEDGIVEFEIQQVEKVYVSWVLDDIELDYIPSPLPFNELPIVPFLGHYWWHEPFGMMALMKDAQKEKNKRRMGIAEVAGRSARSGLVHESDALEDPQQVDLFFNGAGARMAVRPGKLRGIEFIQPPQLDQNLMTLERWATEELPQTLNLTPESLGHSDAGTQSGRAFEAKARTGMLSQETMFDTYNDELEWVTKLLIEMVKDNITEIEAMRIVGRVAIEDPMDDMAAKATKSTSRLAEVLSDAFNTEYDIVITSKPYEPSYELAKFNSLMEMNRQGIPVPPQIAVKRAMDAGIIDKKDGMDWLAAVAPQLQQPMAGPGGQQLPTSVEGMEASAAQQEVPQF